MDEGPTISYPVAVVAGRPDENYARAFVEFLGSSSARPAFEEAGFVFLPAAKADAK